MILAVVIACLVGALGCLVYALLEQRSPSELTAPQNRKDTTPHSRSVLVRQVAAVCVAVVLLLLAATVALIEDKVGSADTGRGGPAVPERDTDPPSGQSTFDYPLPAEDLDNFAEWTRTAYAPVQESLCLVNYHDQDVEVGAGRSYKWWTSCGEADGFATIAEVRDELALPPVWGARNAVAVACVPQGAKLAFVSGPAAAVRSNGRRYPGGGLQFRVLGFDPKWIVARQSLPTPPAELPPLDRRSCPR